MRKKPLKAQILVITVIVLLLLSIIVIGIIAVVTRDVGQSVSSQQYETSYNKTEEKMLKMLDSYGDTDVALTGLLTWEGCTLQSTVYQCQSTDGNLTTKVNVEDTNLVKDYELGKDGTFKVILGSYTGNLEISWTGDTALLMTLEYKATSGQYESVQDVYDNTGILTSSGSSAADHPMHATVPAGKNNTIIVNVGGITLPAAASSRSFFKIKVLMNDNSHISTLLGVKGDNTLPKQIRKFEGVSYYQSATTAYSSAPTLITQIPLAGKDTGLMDYVLRSNTIVSK
jgi:hypothetical protein